MENSNEDPDRANSGKERSRKVMIAVTILLAVVAIWFKIQTHRQKQRAHQQFYRPTNEDRIRQEAMLEKMRDHCANPSDAPERKEVEWKTPDDSLSLVEKAMA